MANEQLTAAQEFCSYHQIDVTLVTAFYDAGLIELTVVDTSYYIPVTQLPRVERLVRLHNELGINVEGLEAVTHLLDRVTGLQQEVQLLRNRLSVYE
jgi:chaperone modulatory protein CbpM